MKINSLRSTSHLMILKVWKGAALALLITFSICARALAVAEEDSCHSDMRWEADVTDPLLVLFSFNGTVPVGSFSYNCIWNFGDGNTSTDSFATHLYSQPGTYTACLEFSICIGGGLSCHDDTCLDITVGTMAQTPELTPHFTNFYSYPNPVHSELHIRTNADKEEVTIRLLGITGNEFLKMKTSEAETIMNTSSLPEGFYLLEVTGNQQTLTRKLLIQK
jgi:hypothetical protein